MKVSNVNNTRVSNDTTARPACLRRSASVNGASPASGLNPTTDLNTPIRQDTRMPRHPNAGPRPQRRPGDREAHAEPNDWRENLGIALASGGRFQQHAAGDVSIPLRSRLDPPRALAGLLRQHRPEGRVPREYNYGPRNTKILPLPRLGPLRPSPAMGEGAENWSRHEAPRTHAWSHPIRPEWAERWRHLVHRTYVEPHVRRNGPRGGVEKR